MPIEYIKIDKDKSLSTFWIKTKLKVLKRFRPQTVMSAYGIRLQGNWDDETFHYYVRGSYGRFLSDFLKNYQDEFIFLDIGANQGLYSVISSSNPNCKRIYAFEPVSPVADLLEKNVVLNQADQVQVVRKAVSEESGRAEVWINTNHTGMSSLRQKANENVEEGKKAVNIDLISSVELDQIIGIPDGRIVVKIDVEGHEEVVIRELLKCSFFNKVSDIFYECDEEWISPENIQQMLEDQGFNQFTQVGSKSHYDILASKK